MRDRVRFMGTRRSISTWQKFCNRSYTDQTISSFTALFVLITSVILFNMFSKPKFAVIRVNFSRKHELYNQNFAKYYLNNFALLSSRPLCGQTWASI